MQHPRSRGVDQGHRLLIGGIVSGPHWDSGEDLADTGAICYLEREEENIEAISLYVYSGSVVIIFLIEMNCDD